MKIKSILLWCFIGILIGIAITTALHFMSYDNLKLCWFGLGCLIAGMILGITIIKVERSSDLRWVQKSSGMN